MRMVSRTRSASVFSLSTTSKRRVKVDTKKRHHWRSKEHQASTNLRRSVSSERQSIDGFADRVVSEELYSLLAPDRLVVWCGHWRSTRFVSMDSTRPSVLTDRIDGHHLSWNLMTDSIADVTSCSHQWLISLAREDRAVRSRRSAVCSMTVIRLTVTWSFLIKVSRSCNFSS